MRLVFRRPSYARIRTLPGDGEYDRHERDQYARDFRLWLAGCGIVVAITLVAFVIYAVVLIRSGWHG